MFMAEDGKNLGHGAGVAEVKLQEAVFHIKVGKDGFCR